MCRKFRWSGYAPFQQSIAFPLIKILDSFHCNLLHYTIFQQKTNKKRDPLFFFIETVLNNNDCNSTLLWTHNVNTSKYPLSISTQFRLLNLNRYNDKEFFYSISNVDVIYFDNDHNDIPLERSCHMSIQTK